MIMGMANYDRNFVQRLSELEKPLYELIEVNNFWCTEKEQNEFGKIKSNSIKDLELYMLEEDKIYTLETDASDIVLGVTLKQSGKQISYISRLLNKAEKNYTVTEKEPLASLWAMENL